MKKIKESLNSLGMMWHEAKTIHKKHKESRLRHLLKLSYKLQDDIWEEMKGYLSDEEKRTGPVRVRGDIKDSKGKQGSGGGKKSRAEGFTLPHEFK